MQRTRFLSVFLIVFLVLSIAPLYKVKAQVSYLKTFEQDGTFLKIPTINIADSVVSYKDTKELYQFNITLAKPPPTNVFTLPIETSGLEFRYQSALNEELDLKLYDFVNATHAFSSFENLYRPENVVGSYAVYKTVKGLGRSKLYHIYRPLIIDAKGAEIWANLTVSKSQMQITIDADWLSKAVYPVIIDPSFGKTDVGASTWNSAYAIGSRYTLSETGTVTDISFYANTASVSCFVAVYDVDGSNDPLNLQTNNSDTTASGWTNVDVADIELSAGEYYLFMEANAGLRYDSGTEAHYNEWLGYWEDPYASDGSVSRDYSIYANYTTGAGPSHTDAELPETAAVTASLETQKAIGNVLSETIVMTSDYATQKTIHVSSGTSTSVTTTLEGSKSITEVLAELSESFAVSASLTVVKALHYALGESSAVTTVLESTKSITEVLAELSETASVSGSLLIQKAIQVLASGTVDITALLDTVKHLGATFIELAESLSITSYLNVVLPEIPLTVEYAIMIGIIALAIALCAFAYVATKRKD